MINIVDEKGCCGCGACYAKCPTKAIKMEPNGILKTIIPLVEEDKCIKCGLCERVCPVINKNSTESQALVQRAYASYTKNDVARKASSSGGMFLTLAQHCIKLGFSVYGAAFDEKMHVKCTRAETSEELFALAKSKYIQSDLSGKYSEIEKKLKSSERVLFVSTPCQVKALKLFLKEDYDNLITVDFFCHGVPSQELFDECIKYEDEKLGRKTLEYSFRAKKKSGVTPHYFSIKYEKNGKIKENLDFYYKSMYYALFQQYITLRESCYDCVFAGRERSSDITIGDFHDIDKYVEGINRFDGVSTVITNTQRGEELFDSVCEGLVVHDMSIDSLIEDKTIFSGGTKKPGGRESFVKAYNEKGLDGIKKSYLGFKKYYKQAIYYRLPKLLKNVLKRFI